MGMFDDVICDVALPGEPKPKHKHFQTKDFSCSLDTYRIKEDGTLWVVEASNTEPKQVLFHGWLNFYMSEGNINSYKDTLWFEYQAKFTDGQLQDIEKLLRQKNRL